MSYTLTAFMRMAGANLDTVAFELRVKVAGKAEVSCVTKGKANANLKITVECSFPKKSEAPAAWKNPDQTAQ